MISLWQITFVSKHRVFQSDRVLGSASLGQADGLLNVQPRAVRIPLIKISFHRASSFERAVQNNARQSVNQQHVTVSRILNILVHALTMHLAGA